MPIEKVEVGDEVEARSQKTGKLEDEPVTALTPRHKDRLLEIRIAGERSPLRPSTHHPFWARHGDQPAHWINSADLRIGDSLLTISGAWRAITAITPVANEETVYNFTVAKDHDYFVGETGFLVHNAGGCGCGPQNPLDGLPRVGSALKKDPYHAFPDIVDNYAGDAIGTPLRAGAMLYQLLGSLNGADGRFEWIVDNDRVTHRFFCVGGGLNGVPIVP